MNHTEGLMVEQLAYYTRRDAGLKKRVDDAMAAGGYRELSKEPSFAEIQRRCDERLGK